MLKIMKVNNTGDLASENVFISVLADCNVGDYLLTDSTYGSDDAPSNKLRHVFFFPSQVVKKGEYISLRTRGGSYHFGKTTTGSPMHAFHWGLKETVWNIDGDKAFLFTAPRALRTVTTVPAKAK